MANINEQKAQNWIEQAQKKLNASGISTWFSSSSSRYEEAAECFSKAANLYKMAKNWKEAGAAYEQAASCQIKLAFKHEAASCYVKAANCFRKCDSQHAIECLQMALDYYTEEGKFSIAAKHAKEIAELCESESDFKQAIDFFQLAADYYEGEGSTSAANGCLLKVALYAAQTEEYDKAIEIYERVAANSIDNNLLKWSVKDYLFRAGLCHLCKGDPVSARRAIDRYCDMDVTFQGQHEHKLLSEMLAAYEEGDVEQFTAAVAEFDSIKKLDAWKTTICLRIKKQIKEIGDGEMDQLL